MASPSHEDIYISIFFPSYAAVSWYSHYGVPIISLPAMPLT